jgi:hypothetical protein
MPGTGRVYKLGRNQVFEFPGILNVNIKSVEFSVETGNEAEVTTRGSGADQEFIPVHRNTTMTVNVTHHTTVHGATGLAQIYPLAGTTGTNHTGIYYVNNIGEPQNLEGEIVHAIQFRRYPD